MFFVNGYILNDYLVDCLDIVSFLSVLSAILVVIAKNPIKSVLFLICLFLSIACYLALLGLDFIGIAYLLVYVGAVSILFLFILMLINVRISELLSDTSNSLFLAILVSIIFYIYIDAISFASPEGGKIHGTVWYVLSHNWDSFLIASSHISSVGNIMYTSFSIWLIITSIILLLAMVGAIVITIKWESNSIKFESNLLAFHISTVLGAVLSWFNNLTIRNIVFIILNNIKFRAILFIIIALPLILFGYKEWLEFTMPIVVITIVFYNLFISKTKVKSYEELLSRLTMYMLTISLILIPFWYYFDFILQGSDLLLWLSSFLSNYTLNMEGGGSNSSDIPPLNKGKGPGGGPGPGGGSNPDPFHYPWYGKAEDQPFGQPIQKDLKYYQLELQKRASILVYQSQSYGVDPNDSSFYSYYSAWKDYLDIAIQTLNEGKKLPPLITYKVDNAGDPVVKAGQLQNINLWERTTPLKCIWGYGMEPNLQVYQIPDYFSQFNGGHTKVSNAELLNVENQGAVVFKAWENWNLTSKDAKAHFEKAFKDSKKLSVTSIVNQSEYHSAFMAEKQNSRGK